MTFSMIALLAAFAFLFCLGATPACRHFFKKYGLLDEPDTHRKLHRTAVPHGGGVGIMLSYMAALAAAYVCIPAGATIYIQHRALFVAVLPATLLIFAVGVADDLRELRPRQKLLGQAVAAVLAVSLGARLSLHHGPAWFSFVVSVAWLIACTNAVNLIDGMDGLASGVGLTATLATLLTALLTGNTGLAIATAPLAGALLAFLRYNFAPASVFLGDSGSLTIGFLLGCLGLVWSAHLGGSGMLGPAFALALPLIDVMLSIGRRYLRGVPIFKGDRGHIHHRVQDLGLSTRNAALVLYGCCVLFAVLAVLQGQLPRLPILVFVGAFAIIAWTGVHQLKYVEFRVARRMFSHTLLRNALRQEIYLEEMRNGLARASTPEECWRVIRHTCDELKIASVQLKIGDHRFSAHLYPSLRNAQCTLHVPLSDDGWIVLTGSISIPPQAMVVALEPIRTLDDERPEPAAHRLPLQNAA